MKTLLLSALLLSFTAQANNYDTLKKQIKKQFKQMKISFPKATKDKNNDSYSLSSNPIPEDPRPVRNMKTRVKITKLRLKETAKLGEDPVIEEVLCERVTYFNMYEPITKDLRLSHGDFVKVTCLDSVYNEKTQTYDHHEVSVGGFGAIINGKIFGNPTDQKWYMGQISVGGVFDKFIDEESSYQGPLFSSAGTKNMANSSLMLKVDPDLRIVCNSSIQESPADDEAGREVSSKKDDQEKNKKDEFTCEMNHPAIYSASIDIEDDQQ